MRRFKKIITAMSLAAIFFVFVFGASAAWSGLPYDSGEIIDPECLPSDLNCTVNVPALAGANTDITSISGLVHSTVSGNSYFTGGKVGIGTTTPGAKLTVVNGSVLAWGEGGLNPAPYGPLGVEWISEKGTFLAGASMHVEWINANVGKHAFNAGLYNYSSGEGAAAIGYLNGAGGKYSLAAGSRASSPGEVSIALGRRPYAVGASSLAIGAFAYANVAKSIVFGGGVVDVSWLINNTPNSLMIGVNSNLPTFFIGPSSGAGTIGKVGVGTSTVSDLLTVAAKNGTSTLAIGEPGLTASCLKFQDVDMAGFTYCKFLDGVIACSQDDCEN